MRIPLIGLLTLCSAAVLPAAKTMDIYFLDAEGGQATLIVSPSGESMVIDTGWPGHENRDADRIAAAAKKAGVKKIDYVLITHYHEDHVGGVAQLANKLPVRNYVDHGPSVESGGRASELFNAYVAYRDKANHIQVKPGDTVPIKGLDVKVLTAGGEVIDQPLPGGGAANPACASFQKKEDDPSENARSVGTLITYGKFRIIDLGDLTWNKEFLLACPNNKIGTVDVYLTTHHGMDISGPAALVHAISPRVAIMNNGARKGGTPAAWQAIHTSPRIEDIWQVHYAVEGGKENNAVDSFIANTDEHCQGAWLKLSASADGSFTVFNSRNKYTKTYPAK